MAVLCTVTASAVPEIDIAAKAAAEGKFEKLTRNDSLLNDFRHALTPPRPGRPASYWFRLNKEFSILSFSREGGFPVLIRFVPRSCSFTIPANPKLKLARRTVNLPQAIIEVAGLPLKKIYIKPNLDKISAEIVAKMNLKDIPDASNTLINLKLYEVDDGTAVYINGSFAGKLDRKISGLDAVLKYDSGDVLDLSQKEELDPDFEKINIDCRAASGGLPSNLLLTEKLPVPMRTDITKSLDLRQAVPMADKIGYFTADVRRYAFDALPGSFLFSVPARQYSRAWVLCSPIPEKDKVNMLPVFRLMMGRFSNMGRAALALPTVEFDLAKKSDTIRQVGTSELIIDGKKVKVPVYLVSAILDHGTIQDILFEDRNSVLPFRNYLDIDLQGPGNRKSLKETKRAAVTVHAVTLEKSPAVVKVGQKTPGNLFEPKDGAPEIPVNITADKAGNYEISWKIGDVMEKEVAAGKMTLKLSAGETRNVAIPVKVPGRGWYSVNLLLKKNGQQIFSFETAAAILAPDTRKWQKGTSPYAGWHWAHFHNAIPDLYRIGPIFKKLGIRYAAAGMEYTAEDWAPYGIGFSQFPNLMKIVYSDARILSKNQEDWDKMGRQFVREVAKFVRKFPETKHIVMHHESYPGQHAEIPPTILGKKPAVFDAKREVLERARARAATEAAKLIRKNFPHLKIVFGNSCYAQGIIESFAARGFDPSLVDYIGSEGVSGDSDPEKFYLTNPTGNSYILRETARLNGYKAKMTACYEWACHSSNPTKNIPDWMEAKRNQAQRYAREVMVAYSYHYNNIPVPSGTDRGTEYQEHGTYGGTGCFTRNYYAPKPAAVSTAVLTRILDQVKFVKSVKSPLEVFLFEFKREDGNYIYTLWTQKGTADCIIHVSGTGNKIESEDLYGRPSVFSVKNGKLKITADQNLRYFITRGRMTSLDLIRKYPCMDEPAKVLKTVEVKASDLYRVKEKEPRVDSRPINTRSFQAAYLVNSTIRDVKDAEKGVCTAVTFDVSPLPKDSWYHGGYTMYRFKNPIPIPSDADCIGIWMKGNGSLGRFAWEVTDETGKSFIANGEPRNGATALNAAYDNEFYSTAWRFRYMALNKKSAKPFPLPWFPLQWHGHGKQTMRTPVKVTGILLSTSNKYPRIFELVPVRDHTVFFRKIVFFTAEEMKKAWKNASEK